jgi:hypothetical protein
MKAALQAFRPGDPPIDDEYVHHWFGYTWARSQAELQSWMDTRWAGWFKFTVVREPIARFVSLFQNKIGGDINRYVLERFEDDEWRRDYHAVPQTFLIGEDLGRYDVVFRLESIAASAGSILTERLGTKIDIPKRNATGGAARMSQACRTKLRAVYARDYEVLEYP